MKIKKDTNDINIIGDNSVDYFENIMSQVNLNKSTIHGKGSMKGIAIEHNSGLT
jgi:hypothetical protein